MKINHLDAITIQCLFDLKRDMQLCHKQLQSFTDLEDHWWWRRASAVVTHSHHQVIQVHTFDGVEQFTRVRFKPSSSSVLCKASARPPRLLGFPSPTRVFSLGLEPSTAWGCKVRLRYSAQKWVVLPSAHLIRIMIMILTCEPKTIMCMVELVSNQRKLGSGVLWVRGVMVSCTWQRTRTSIFNTQILTVLKLQLLNKSFMLHIMVLLGSWWKSDLETPDMFFDSGLGSWSVIVGAESSAAALHSF